MNKDAETLYVNVYNVNIWQFFDLLKRIGSFDSDNNLLLDGNIEKILKDYLKESAFEDFLNISGALNYLLTRNRNNVNKRKLEGYLKVLGKSDKGKVSEALDFYHSLREKGKRTNILYHVIDKFGVEVGSYLLEVLRRFKGKNLRKLAASLFDAILERIDDISYYVYVLYKKSANLFVGYGIPRDLRDILDNNKVEEKILERYKNDRLALRYVMNILRYRVEEGKVLSEEFNKIAGKIKTIFGEEEVGKYLQKFIKDSSTVVSIREVDEEYFPGIDIEALKQASGLPV